MITLYKGDCLVEMNKIADKSIDMILCDLPYGTTACSWDVVIPFDKLWEQYNRIVKPCGAIVLFGSEPFTSQMICSNIDNYSHSWIWNKNNASNYPLANKMPLKITEDIIVFYKSEYDFSSNLELRLFFKNILQRINKNKKEIIDELGQGLDHCFRTDSLQFCLPTKTNYEKLKKHYELFDLPSYEELVDKKDNYNRLFNPQGIQEKNKIKDRKKSALHFGENSKLNTVNFQKFTNYPKNILNFKYDKEKLHPTQKPIALLEYLIKTYTNENEIVLDNCMGSGSTGVACINTNRSFIGIEKDDNYFEIAKQRIEQVNKEKQNQLF